MCFWCAARSRWGQVQACRGARPISLRRESGGLPPQRGSSLIAKIVAATNRLTAARAHLPNSTNAVHRRSRNSGRPGRCKHLVGLTCRRNWKFLSRHTCSVNRRATRLSIDRRLTVHGDVVMLSQPTRSRKVHSDGDRGGGLPIS